MTSPSIPKVSQAQLKEAIQKAVVKALTESNHFTAMRNIEHLATSTSMEFEKTICDSLGIISPDTLQPDLQEKYFAIVQIMKTGVVESVMTAARQLVSFPREQDSAVNRK